MNHTSFERFLRDQSKNPYVLFRRQRIACDEGVLMHALQLCGSTYTISANLLGVLGMLVLVVLVQVVTSLLSVSVPSWQ